MNIMANIEEAPTCSALPLEVVGHIDVPAGVMQHRFVIEALACMRVLGERREEDSKPGAEVVGTANTGEVELYGWLTNVPDHVDKTGFIYFVALNDGKSMVECIQGDQAYSVALQRGDVVRLNDHWQHWTIDTEERVCAFIGSYDEPCDEWAINRLTAGIEALDDGAYYGAPRVQHGFRVYGPDECLVPSGPDMQVQPMLLADAIAQKLDYVTCSECDKPAAVMDHHWPYHTDCRCYAHH